MSGHSKWSSIKHKKGAADAKRGKLFTKLARAIDVGAEDVSEDGDLLKIPTAASELTAVRSALESAGVEVQSAELSMEPKSTVEVGESDAPALLRLMDALEDQDDVDSVHANF